MYSPIQIEVIKAFGSKQLSEGCLFTYKYVNIRDGILQSTHIENDLYRICGEGVMGGRSAYPLGNIFLPEKNKIYYENYGIDTFLQESKRDESVVGYRIINEILGHIPHINDIFRMAKDKFADTDIHMGYLVFFSIDPMLTKDVEGMHMIPYNQSFDLLDQEESTLVQLLTLFK